MKNLSINEYTDYFDIMCRSIEWNRAQMKKQNSQSDLFRRRKISDIVYLDRAVDKYNKIYYSKNVEIKFKNSNIIGVSRVI